MRLAIHKLFVLTAFVFSPILEAATPYEDEVPIELARYFLPGNWYSDLPPGLPAFTIPAGWELVGSQDQTQRKRVLFRSTSIDADEAQETLAQAILGEVAWVRMDDSINRGPLVGFIARDYEPPLPSVRVCHDSIGTIIIEGRANGFVHLDFFDPAFFNSQSCSLRSQQEMRVFGSRPELMDFVPVLEVPANINPSVAPRIRNLAPGQPFDYDTETRITADISLRRLTNNLARQMRRQGWRRNEAWRGDVTAGTNWTRELQNGNRLLASINILRMGENDYTIKLRVAETPQEEQ
jgi:hypothetical protein